MNYSLVSLVKHTLMKGAIFEADGGAWRNQAILNIKKYLGEQLSDEIKKGKITILA